MKKRLFLIPSLMAAGFPLDRADALAQVGSLIDEPPPQPLFDVFRLDHEYNLAAHRSHSSHGSHGSHGSHRSGSGGSAVPRYSPPPAYSPPPPSRNLESTPPSSVLPGSPSTAPQKILPGNTGKFFDIVREVQTALYAYGYYTGAIDGIVGPQTRAALTKFQKDYGLAITGTVTPETLDALKVTAQ